MARGGKRVGAGRKPGSKTKVNSDIALKAAQDGITPIEVMLNTMRYFYQKKEYAEAADIAAKAAPYCHPRLSAIELKGSENSPVNTNMKIEFVPANESPEHTE